MARFPRRRAGRRNDGFRCHGARPCSAAAVGSPQQTPETRCPPRAGDANRRSRLDEARSEPDHFPFRLPAQRIPQDRSAGLSPTLKGSSEGCCPPRRRYLPARWIAAPWLFLAAAKQGCWGLGGEPGAPQ
ncbi:hypothetical protein C2845_PM16G13830 [Panicum miliaceum]|uniref:Uncharacterized protein n=1 Tax=Panicum miliaceum TaxID=4540 RepID=A0A3L6PY07_PANMI|nr:hypothetical protein C2845_PM16G13830 [Panicum miliaceum]